MNLKELSKQFSDFVVGTEGNISQRTENGFIIKASGRSLEDAFFVECDFDGIALSDQDHKPSMEASFHAWIYKNSNYEVIAHTHPTNTLKILCSIWGSRFAEERLFPDQVVFNGATSCLVPYATPGNDLTKVIKNAASDFLDLYKEFPSLFLLENHGIICCANSVQRTLTMTQICEKAAEIFVGSKRLGSQNCLARTEVFAIAQHEDEVYRKELQ